MKKLFLFSFAVLVMPLAAFAATFPNLKFSNNQTTTDCTAGQTVNFVARLNVPSGQVVEKVQTDVISDNIAPELAGDVGGELGLQEGQHDVNLSVICPQNTGYYTIEVRGSGVFGGQRANSITDGVISVNTFSNALRVVASTNTSSSTSNGETSMLSSLMNQLAALIVALKEGIGGAPALAPVSATSPVCAAYKTAKVGTQMSVYNDANVRFQGFLLSQGASIPALAEGASFGFYGPQTASADAWFQSINQCY